MSEFGSTSAPPPGLSPRPRSLPPKFLFLLVAVPVAALIIWLGTRPNAMKKAANLGSAVRNPSSLLSGEAKPKPAAGKLLVPDTPPAPLPPVPAWSNSTAANQQPANAPAPLPNGMAASVAPAPIPGATTAAPNVTARPPFVPLAYNARHEKAFGGSCSGQLVLNSNGLDFTCSDDPHGNLHIAVSEISDVDENGFRLGSGKKFHFSIAGMNKPGEQQLFADWLNRVR